MIIELKIVRYCKKGDSITNKIISPAYEIKILIVLGSIIVHPSNDVKGRPYQPQYKEGKA